MPVYVREFDHFIPAEFLFQNTQIGPFLPGFATAMANMERLIGDLNALIDK